MKIDIEVVGTFCNNWPNLIVEINNKKIYDSTVKNKETITLEFEDLITQGMGHEVKEQQNNRGSNDYDCFIKVK